MPILFHSELTEFSLKNKKRLKEWITETIRDHSFKAGDLNFIFCDDQYLLKINQEYLDHNTFTDIITFPYGFPGDKMINGDIFISVDRVKENAEKFGEEFQNELHRVMIHGVLHLCGLGDKTAAQKTKMRAAENEYLKRLGK